MWWWAQPRSFRNFSFGFWQKGLSLCRHADNSSYGLLLQGTATSPNITGPYTFQAAFNPLGDKSQDFGMFVGNDDDAYALYSNGDSAAGRDVIISGINEERTNLTEVIYTFQGISIRGNVGRLSNGWLLSAADFDLEAPSIIQTDGYYYLVASHKTGVRLH